MRNLLEFLRKYYYWLLFFLLEGLSFALIFNFENYPNSVWFTSANAMAATVNGWYNDAVAYFNLGDVNKDLTARNVVLQRQVDILRNELQDAKVDSSYTSQRINDCLNGFRLISAKVVGNSLRENNNYLVIDKGEQEGIRPEMGVVCGAGVVGIVYIVGPHHSLVLPVINKKSSISVRIRGHRFFGFLQWNGGSAMNAIVNDIPRYAGVKTNDVIETSGYSTIFPPGIFVGRVRVVSNSDDGLSFKLKILLGTNFANLRDVMVVATENKAEIDTLRARAAQFDQPNPQ